MRAISWLSVRVINKAVIRRCGRGICVVMVSLNGAFVRTWSRSRLLSDFAVARRQHAPLKSPQNTNFNKRSTTDVDERCQLVAEYRKQRHDISDDGISPKVAFPCYGSVFNVREVGPPQLHVSIWNLHLYLTSPLLKFATYAVFACDGRKNQTGRPTSRSPAKLS